MFLMNSIDPIVEATYMVSFSLRMVEEGTVYASNTHVESTRLHFMTVGKPLLCTHVSET